MEAFYVATFFWIKMMGFLLDDDEPLPHRIHVGVSENSVTPKSSI